MTQSDSDRPHDLAGEIERLRRNSARRSSGRGFELAEQWNASSGEVDYLYRRDQLICESHDLERVLAAFDQLGHDRPDDVTDGPAGLKILHVEGREAVDLAESLAGLLGDDVVTLNHVLDAQGFPKMCPATEPVPWQGPILDFGEPVGPGRPRLAVIDTGYAPSVRQDSSYGRLAAVEATSEIDDAVYGPAGVIIPYGGHGTAPAARLLAVSGSNSVHVRVRDCLVGGAVDELTIVEDLERVITDGVDIISIQAGLHTHGGRPPKAFDAFSRQVLRHYPQIILVVAAGNQGSDRPFWPAAYDWCTAVGALTHGGDARTGWTNYGYWVDVYASGENIVVPFPNGTYTYLDGLQADFTQGHAIWSGTSFAAPVVAGMIARRMIERNISAPDARDVVLAEAAVAALPATGPRVLV